MTIAAPGPVFGVKDEASGDWIAVDIAELFEPLGVREDVEVVVTGLPELFAVAFQELRGLSFEDAQGGREGFSFRFAEKKVDMLGHEDVAVYLEAVSLAELFECVQEDAAGVVVVQERLPVEAAESDEVVVACGLVTFQAAGHGS